MSKVDWITWKTDVTDIINPEKVIDSVTDSYNEFNSYMNPVIYENLKYEVINGGLDKSSINIHYPSSGILSSLPGTALYINEYPASCSLNFNIPPPRN